jgi:hypothetical protein
MQVVGCRKINLCRQEIITGKAYLMKANRVLTGNSLAPTRSIVERHSLSEKEKP